MVTRQATPRHTWVLLLIVPFLLPLAGCEPTTPKTTPPKTTEPTSAGTTWTVASYGAGALDGGSGPSLISLGGVAWGGGRFVAVGLKIGDSYIKELIVHSTDGTTWTAAPSVVGTHILRGVAWGSGRFVAVGSSLDGVLGGRLRSTGVGMHSTDGATWSAALGIGEAGDAVSTYLVLFYGLTRVTWGGGRFVAVGNRRDGDRTVGVIVHSTDGATWTVASGVDGFDSLSGVAWGGGRFVAVGSITETDPSGGYGLISGVVLRSTDGLTWTSASVVDGTTSLARVTWGGGRFVAVGSRRDGDRSVAVIVHSTDGATWTAASGVDGFDNLSGVAWGGGRFVAFRSNIGLDDDRRHFLHSTDGATWTAASPMNGAAWEAGNVNISGVTYDGTRFVAVGDSGGAGSRDGLILTSP